MAIFIVVPIQLVALAVSFIIEDRYWQSYLRGIIAGIAICTTALLIWK